MANELETLKRDVAELQHPVFYYFFTISVKYSLVSFTTIGLKNASAIKLGIAIRPFKVSAILQARVSSTVPAIQANPQKIT